MEYIKDRHFYFLVVILGAVFVVNFIKISSIMQYFPLHSFTDGTGYIGRLTLLIKYGYHGFAPNWYNGFIVLKHYAPGWFFFTLPIYWLTKNVLISTFISMLVSYIFSLIFFILLGKTFKLSIIKSISFFLLFYLSPTAFVNFFILGRPPELLAITIFILGFVLIYKVKTWNTRNLILFFLFFSLLSLQQQGVTILFTFLVAGLLLTLTWQKRFYIVLGMLGAMLLSSFWWIPFLDYKGTGVELITGIGLDNFISIGSLITLIFLVSFYFYWNGRHRNKRDLLFFSPILVIAVLYLTRIVAFMPFFNKIWPNSYNLFFSFLTIFFILRTNFQPNIRKIITMGLYIIPLLFLLIPVIYPVQSFEYNDVDKETLSIFKDVNDRMLIVYTNDTSISTRSLVAYATLHHNVTTPDGWGEFSVSKDLFKKVESAKYIENKSCADIQKSFDELEIKQIVGLSNACTILSDCGYIYKIKKENVCLFQSTIDYKKVYNING